MGREIRYPDGTVRHVFGGPDARRPRRRRPSGTLIFVALALAAVWLANHGAL